MNNAGADGKTPIDAAEKGAQLEHDIEAIRDNLGGLVGELDRRRHRVFNIRAQLRDHAIPLAIGMVTLAGLLAGGVAVVRARRRPTLTKRASRLRQAAWGALGAALFRNGMATVLARRLAERLVARPVFAEAVKTGATRA